MGLYKNEFNDVFNDYLKRKWMFINRKNYNEFESFIKNMDYIIAKPNNNTNGKKIEKIKVISIAPLFANAIKNVHENKPLGDLLKIN